MVLLLPLINIVVLSDTIKGFTDSAKNSPLTLILLGFYSVIIMCCGILGPIKALHELNNSKQARKGETPKDFLRRIISRINASRNYLLGAFSLFFLWVIIRLFDLVQLSTKLHKFSDLITNYDLVFIALINEPGFDNENNALIEESIGHKDETVAWLVKTNFNDTKHYQMKPFLRETPKKLAFLANKVKGLSEKNNNFVADQYIKDKSDTDISEKTYTIEEVFEIKPNQN